MTKLGSVTSRSTGGSQTQLAGSFNQSGAAIDRDIDSIIKLLGISSLLANSLSRFWTFQTASIKIKGVKSVSVLQKILVSHSLFHYCRRRMMEMFDQLPTLRSSCFKADRISPCPGRLP